MRRPRACLKSGLGARSRGRLTLVFSSAIIRYYILGKNYMTKKITINDLAIMVQQGFEEVDEKLKKGFEEMEGKVGGLEKKMEKGFKELKQDMDRGFEGVKKEIKGIKEIDDTHGLKIKDLERRTVVLENKTGVKS